MRADGDGALPDDMAVVADRGWEEEGEDEEDGFEERPDRRGEGAMRAAKGEGDCEQLIAVLAVLSVAALLAG